MVGAVKSRTWWSRDGGDRRDRRELGVVEVQGMVGGIGGSWNLKDYGDLEMVGV